ncbi:MAG: type II toxin -antitoxin system TacA 1-like antitoxin, partial [Syntrophales bacterium]
MCVHCPYNNMTHREVIMATSKVMAKASSSQKRASAVRSGRLGLRTTPVQAALIQRAAEVSRRSITQF